MGHKTLIFIKEKITYTIRVLHRLVYSKILYYVLALIAQETMDPLLQC